MSRKEVLELTRFDFCAVNANLCTSVGSSLVNILCGCAWDMCRVSLRDLCLCVCVCVCVCPAMAVLHHLFGGVVTHSF